MHGAGAPTVVHALEADGDRARACLAVNDDDRFDNSVGGLRDQSAADRETGPVRGEVLERSGALGNVDALEEMVVDLVGDPAGYLVELAGTGQDFQNAAREVLGQQSGIRKLAGTRGLMAKEIFGDETGEASVHARDLALYSPA